MRQFRKKTLGCETIFFYILLKKKRKRKYDGDNRSDYFINNLERIIYSYYLRIITSFIREKKKLDVRLFFSIRCITLATIT